MIETNLNSVWIILGGSPSARPENHSDLNPVRKIILIRRCVAGRVALKSGVESAHCIILLGSMPGQDSKDERNSMDFDMLGSWQALTLMNVATVVS